MVGNAGILAGAIPIALIVNAVRITVTGVMYTVNADIAEKIFHDWAGYFMMPMALGMLFLVQQILALIVISEDQTPAVAVRVGGARQPSQAAQPLPPRPAAARPPVTANTQNPAGVAVRPGEGPGTGQKRAP